jgi:hypothetical protein
MSGTVPPQQANKAFFARFERAELGFKVDMWRSVRTFDNSSDERHAYWANKLTKTAWRLID